MADRGRPRTFDRASALDQATQLFWRKTYEGTSIADLTQAIGISAPSLYAAFGSKEALFREAVAHYVAHYGQAIWRALEKAPTVRQAIEGFLLATAEAYAQPGDPPGCMIILGTQHGCEAPNAALRELRGRRLENIDQLAHRFRRGVDEGELAPDFPVGDAAAFYCAVQTGMSVLARDGCDRATLEAIARSAMLGWERWGAN